MMPDDRAIRSDRTLSWRQKIAAGVSRPGRTPGATAAHGSRAWPAGARGIRLGAGRARA